MMSERKVVIAGFARSPFTPANKGDLKNVRADDLAAQTVKGLVEKLKLEPSLIEDLKLGCAFPEGEQGLNLARNVALLAGLPEAVAGVTINRFCGSSMQAIHDAAGAIKMGMMDCVIAAGVESMTRVPMPGFNPSPNPDLAAKSKGAYMSMGETAENVATRFNVTRAEQDDFSLISHFKAASAQKDGAFKDEIIPITKKKGQIISEDGCIRSSTTAEDLAKLKPAFKADGSVTAGSSSPLTDGASAVLVCSEDFALKHKLPILAEIISFASTGCDPEIMGMGPVTATEKALAKAGISKDKLGVVELNEAFASQAIACVKQLGLDPYIVNKDGGAIALGHPMGATGARITGKAALLLSQDLKAEYALASQCIGGGQGIATVLKKYKKPDHKAA
jgi:acetyl-CoA acyltransferase